MTHDPREALEAERAELVAKNEAATSWGAAVGARSERIKEIDRELSALTASPGEQKPAPGWEERETDLALAINNELCRQIDASEEKDTLNVTSKIVALPIMQGMIRREAPASSGLDQLLTITYTNYKGETSARRIAPKSIRFGSTEWHPEPQWLLLAHDVDKQADREFALKDFGSRPDAGGDVRLPQGYALVPTKPTPAMIEAGCEQNPTQWNEGTDLGFAADVANDVYVAMVRAAALSTPSDAVNESAEARLREGGQSPGAVTSPEKAGIKPGPSDLPVRREIVARIIHGDDADFDDLKEAAMSHGPHQKYRDQLSSLYDKADRILSALGKVRP